MKRITLFAATVFMIVSGAVAQQPQLEKGNIMIGVTSTASLGGSWGSDLMSIGILHTKVTSGSNTYNEHNNRSFSLIPKGSYFIMDNLTVGLQTLLARFSNQHVDSDGKWTETTLGIGPFVRYYYPLEKVYPFAELETMIGSCVEKSPNSGSGYDEDRYSLFTAGLYLGAAVPLGDLVTFDIMAGYVRTVWKESEEDEDDFREIYLGPAIRMGFTVYL